MKDEEIVGILRRMIRSGLEAGPGPEELGQAMNYYFCRPRGDEMAGRSIVQSADVADTVHAVLAQVMGSFTQDSVCQFEPDGPEDEAQARLESDATNKVMMESSRGYLVFYTAVKDALLLKDGVVKAYLVEDERGRRIRLDAVDPLSFVVSDQQDSVLLDSLRSQFCAERKEYSRGELVAMGLDAEQIDRVPSGMDSESETQNTRRSARSTPVVDHVGWANETVTLWEIYARLPQELDSKETRLYRCLLGGQELLLREETDTIPYAAGCVEPLPHRYWGLSVYDLTRSIQDSKTAIKRQWLDNLANCNNSRVVANEAINLDDLMSGRPGGVVRSRSLAPVAENILPLPSVDVGPAAQAFLAYEDQVRADRAGSALNMATSEMQTAAGSIGSMGVDRIFSVQELRSGLMARTLAETLLRSAFMLVHRLLRLELKEPMVLRMADQWVTVDPSTWRHRDRVNIRSGLSPGERSRKATAMTQVLQMQTQALQLGMDGVMVTLPNLYNAFLDWASANELDAGEKYFSDPKSQSSQQAAAGKAQQGQELQALQLQLEQAKLSLEQQKLQLEAQKADAELKFKYYDARLSAEVEEAKIVGAATADLQRVELEGQFALATAQSAGMGAGSAGNGSDSGQ